MPIFRFHHLYLLPLICCSAAMAQTSTINFPKEDFESTDSGLREADMLFEAGLIERSIDAYQKLLSAATEPQTLMQTRFHLALAYVSQHDYSKAITLLQENINLAPDDLSKSLEEVRRNSLFLAAMAYKESKQFDKAKEAFSQYSYMPQPPALAFYDEARFEIGLIEFQLDRYAEAAKIFQAISTEKGRPRLALLSGLYLARIDLSQGRPEAAAALLTKLVFKVPPNDPLSYELSYLQGEAAFQTHNYTQAIASFHDSIPSKHPEDVSWYPEAMYHLGWSYLKQADAFMNSAKEQVNSLDNAQKAFTQMLAAAPQEKGYLALAQCHLSRVKLLKQSESYAKAEAILSQSDNFQSSEAKAHALLLRAEAAPTYEMRDAFYRQLTQEDNSGNAYYSKGWYMRALNDFEQGLQLQQKGDASASQAIFKQSASEFAKASSLLNNLDDVLAANAVKYQALAISHSGQAQADLAAYELIDSVIKNPKKTGSQDELHYLHGYFAGRLALGDSSYLPIAVKSLHASASIPNSQFSDISLNYLATLYFQLADYPKAEMTYQNLAEAYPDSPLAGDAWYWSASCADLLGKERKIGNQRRRRVFEGYSTSTYAPEAYFTYYTYQDYLQGDRNAIKHLQTFEEKYKNTPYLIEAYYLIGLDYIRDRKTAEGKWIRKKSLTDAIDAFQHAETLFDTLKEEGSLPESKQEYYLTLRYRATLQRAMANLAIAEDAQGAKQKIYLDYAEQVFKTLLADLKDIPYQNNVRTSILEESSFGLAKTYIKGGQDQKADKILTQLLDNYKNGNVTRGYYLARSWDEKARIAMRAKDYKAALTSFNNAEEASKGNLLSTDQKLDLWIQQSLCCRGQEHFDDAILILSKVVNDDAVSALRLKAMYLRAETYELQGRLELARKQLESMVKKGGVWARKAKEKLDKDYGH